MLLGLLLAAGLGILSIHAETNAVARAESAYQAAAALFGAQPTNTVAAWQLARRAFDKAELAADDKAREATALEGIKAARAAIGLDAQAGPAHYYLALNLGQLARTKLLGALKLVQEMEKTWKTAAQLDPRFDHAGPDRSLGILYAEAPGWPTSIGSWSKARQHLQRAVELAPDYPENRLALMDVLNKSKEWKTLATNTTAYAALLPAARTNLTGPDWEAAWQDWDRRWLQLQKKHPAK